MENWSYCTFVISPLAKIQQIPETYKHFGNFF